MGTKTDPGQFDCHSKAEPDEPLFTLLARDPLAPGLVAIWAALNSGHFSAAGAFFNDLAQRAISLPPERKEKTDEAFRCAATMELWLREREASPGPTDQVRGRLGQGSGARIAGPQNPPRPPRPREWA